MVTSPEIEFVQLSPDFGCYGMGTQGARMELEAIHRETFVERTYLENGVTVPAGATILDVGANVGLFSLAMKVHCPTARIHAFEPAVLSLEALRANLRLHDAEDVTVHPIALGATDDATAAFSFYPNMPGNSTCFPESKTFDRAVIVAEWGTELGDTLYGARMFEVPVARLSTILRGHPEIERIDLLKIDVEGGELNVLDGIEEQDWPRIRQIVMEVQDVDGALDTAVELLRVHGFDTTVETPESLAHLRYRIVYALRASA